MADLLMHLATMKASGAWRENGGTFVPYPATWLRAEGWHDEPQPGKVNGANGNGRAQVPEERIDFDARRKDGAIHFNDDSILWSATQRAWVPVAEWKAGQ